MRIVFIQQLWYEWQAPMIFSAIAKRKNHSCVMHIVPSGARAIRKVMNENANLVVFSSITSGNMQFVYDCAKRIKMHKNIPILIGGVYVSLFYKRINLQNIDYLGVGEGEYTFSSLLDALEGKLPLTDVPGLGYMCGNQMRINKSAVIHNLDYLPFMDRELYYKYPVFRYEAVRMFYSGRGCKYNCSYCCVPSLLRMDLKVPLIRKKSPENMIEEIREVQKQYGLKAAFFQDDCFTQDYEWLKSFLILYKNEINKPLMCMSRAADITPEVAEALAAGGCISIGIGIETSNENVRINLRRKESNAQIEKAIELLHEYKIKVTTFNMLGIPGEDFESIKQTILFNHYNRVESPWGVLYQPYLDEDTGKLIHGNGNFYSKLGYECLDSKKIEVAQKLFPILVRWPKLQKYLLKFTPKGVAYLIFSLQSFSREICIWKRSFILTLVIGIKNQLIYYFANKVERNG